MSNKILKNIDILKPFTKNLNTKTHGRELSREEKIDYSQKTIQNKLNQLAKQKILESQKKGRIKEFQLNKNNIMTLPALIMAEIAKFHDLISTNFEIHQIIKDIQKETKDPTLIYGSFAKGNWTKKSDLDILIIGNKNKELEKIKDRYSREIQYMYMNQKEFKKGIEKKETYITEIIRNHIICQGFETITDWRIQYE